MPRRAAALATPAASTPLTDATYIQQQDDPFLPDLSLLRRQWKWAAFSQFFYTFANLFAMPDLSLTDIEDDLTRSTSIVIHRVIHRLLVTATQDRKLSLENWQTALRKQYKKRDPHLNPIGPEPIVQLPTPAPDSPQVPDDEEPKAESVSTPGPSSGPFPENRHPTDVDADHPFVHGHSEVSSTDMNLDEMKVGFEGAALSEPEEESKDWLSLPMLAKLDSLHLLTEWQFHNVNRFRSIMKDDDDTAQWRIEPIGYDSKANAYWLIGPDRLWIQRALPKPPRNLKRKRAQTKPKSRRPIIFDDDESDEPPTPKKRKPARQNTIRVPPAIPRTPSRPRRPPSSAEELGPISNRGPRAAKMQASAKLTAQAKELAELQRQAALEARRSGKRMASPSHSQKGGPVRPMGTRMSARLRGVVHSDDEWQEIPDEWLRDGGNEARDGSGNERLEEDGDGEAEARASSPKSEPELEPDAMQDTDTDAYRTKTGLESDDDAVSALTELSEISPPATVITPKSRKASKKSRGGGSRKKSSSRSKRQTLTVDDDSMLALPPPPHLEEPGEEEVELAWRPPDDFVEWETICVTLYEWEHICERFEGATHYSEKALYKLLSQQIVPAITAELREIQRKRQLDEAVSQRKRSSRLAMKESEKEEARLAAIRKAEEEEKLGRVRRLEARQKREEEERLKREVAREKRRLDREERERNAQESDVEERTKAVDIIGDDPPLFPPAKPPKAKPGRPRTKAVTQANSSAGATPSGSRTPVGEDWVLDCEICHRTGVNKDDGSPLLCCGKCSKWQHIACHDLADRKAGRPKRDWDSEEFVCCACLVGHNAAVNVNGKGKRMQLANGSILLPVPSSSSSSFDAAGGRTPSPYRGYVGQVASNYTPPPQHSRPSSYRDQQQSHHSAITFTHYQPQQHGFSIGTHTHQQQQQMPYPQPHYNNTPSSKLAQYHHHHQQYLPHPYPNGNNANWPSAPASPAPSGAATSWSPRVQTSYAPAASTAAPSSSPLYNSSAEHSLMLSGTPQRNGNTVTGATTSTSQSQSHSQPWRGNPYVPVGDNPGVSSYHSQSLQSSQAHPPPQQPQPQPQQQQQHRTMAP